MAAITIRKPLGSPGCGARGSGFPGARSAGCVLAGSGLKPPAPSLGAYPGWEQRDGIQGGGEKLQTPRARQLPESSGCHRLGTRPARARGKGDGTGAHWDPSRGGPGAPAQVGIRPGEGPVRRGAGRPHPGPEPFPWLKVAKVRRCVRVRRNLLVLPSSTRRVNAFIGDSAFWEHRSPSHSLPSWPSPGPPGARAGRGRGTVRQGGGAWCAGHHAGGRGRPPLQRWGWPGSLWLPRSHRATEQLPLSPRCSRGCATASPRAPQWCGGSQPGRRTHVPASSRCRWPLQRSSPTGTLAAGPTQGCASGGTARVLGATVATAPWEHRRRRDEDLEPRGLRLPEAPGSVGWWKHQLRAPLPGRGGRLGVSQKPSFVLCF